MYFTIYNVTLVTVKEKYDDKEMHFNYKHGKINEGGGQNYNGFMLCKFFSCADLLNVSTITTSGCVKTLLAGVNLLLQTYGILL